MNDPIKDFVEQHREEFDHLEAPVFKLDQLKSKFQQVPEVKARKLSIMNGSKWLVAASILITLSCAWFIFYNNDSKKPTVQLAGHKLRPLPGKNVDAGRLNAAVKPSLGDPAEQRVDQGQQAGAPVQQVYAHKQLVEHKVHTSSVATADRYANLKDSTSASTRLLAILEIEKAGRLESQEIDLLALTLNHDGNTNVRLAALSLMQKYRDDEQVSALLVRSLDDQDDPMVQLGLVGILGKMNNIEIDDKLASLATSPETFAAVRDEAYSILLSQNKL